MAAAAKETSSFIQKTIRIRITSAGIATVLCFGILGCGAMSENPSDTTTPPKRQVIDPDKAEAKAQRISSMLLDVTGIKGKVTPSGPRVMTSGQHPGNYYVRHSWSIWGVSEGQLKKGMKKLHAELPNHGWKIGKYERANSVARQLQLEAFNPRHKFLAQVELLIHDTGAEVSPKEDLLLFTVSSPTFTAPEGEEID